MWGNKMIEDIRKIITYEEIINVEGGKKAPNDLRLIGVAAVLKNPDLPRKRLHAGLGSR